MQHGGSGSDSTASEPGRVCAVAYTDYSSDPRVRREAEALARGGMHVTVLALRRPGEPAEEWIDGVHVVHFPVVRHRGGALRDYLASYASFFVRAAWYLGRRPRQFDLVHAHSVPEVIVFAALVQRCTGRPVVLDVHDLSTELYTNRLGDVPPPVRWAERISLRFADTVITVHDRYRELLAERGVPPEKVTVILNTPDERVFGTGRAPAWAPEHLRLVYHGALVERYGLGVALDALHILRERIPGVHLTIYGDGDYRDEIAQRIAREELDDVVSLSAGAVPVSEIASLVSGAHIGLVPFLASQFTANILPTKLLEYVLLGIPAVVSRNDVVERYFSDDMVQYIRPGDPLALAAAVESLWKEPERALAMARRAQAVVREHSWASEQERLRTLIEGLVSR